MYENPWVKTYFDLLNQNLKDKKIELISFFTNSHEKLLYEYLIPSLKCDDGFNLVLLKGEQFCSTASYYEEGWFETVAQKISSLMSYLENLKEGTKFIFTDPDVIFLQPCTQILHELINKTDKDILFMDDYEGGVCTGFFVAKKSQNLIDFLHMVVNFIKENKVGDQKSVNCILKNQTSKFWDFEKLSKDLKYEGNISFDFLPRNEFINYRNFCNKEYNTNKIEFQTPPEAKIFHANWCKGLESKYELLDYVKKTYK